MAVRIHAFERRWLWSVGCTCHFGVGIDFQIDFRRLREVDANGPAVVYVSVEASGVLLTLRTPCAPRARREVTDAIWQDVLTAFGQCPDVDFAYPTTRWYAHDAEGKPAMRPAGAP